MEERNILEGNKLIAEFMQHEEGYDTHGVWQKLQYHSSWDWIMPVVEKIQAMGFKFIIGDTNRVTVYNKDYDWRNGSTSDPLIECVWHGVTQFINWYSTNKQNKVI